MARQREPKTLEEAGKLLLAAMPDESFYVMVYCNDSRCYGNGSCHHSVDFSCSILRGGEHVVSSVHATTPAKLVKLVLEEFGKALLGKGLIVVDATEDHPRRAAARREAPRIKSNVPLLRFGG